LYGPPKIDLTGIDSIQIPFSLVDEIENFTGITVARGIFRRTNLEDQDKIIKSLFLREKTKIVFETTNVEHFKINSEKILNAIQKNQKS